MPYIPKELRYEVAVRYPVTPGELNYLFTKIIRQYMVKKGLNYQTINDIIGALEGAKLEFYREVAAPYENEKRELNGDVFHDRT